MYYNIWLGWVRRTLAGLDVVSDLHGYTGLVFDFQIMFDDGYVYLWNTWVE